MISETEARLGSVLVRFWSLTELGWLNFCRTSDETQAVNSCAVLSVCNTNTLAVVGLVMTNGVSLPKSVTMEFDKLLASVAMSTCDDLNDILFIHAMQRNLISVTI